MKRIVSCLLIFIAFLPVVGQTQPVAVLRTSSDKLIMYLDGEKDDFNGINSLGSSLEYSFVVKNDSVRFTLVSESDSVSFILRPKLITRFQIVRQSKKDTVTCNFTMQKLVKPAIFDDKYKKANTGKTIIEVPEVYELVNIVIALTDYGKTNAIYKNTGYYDIMLKHFQSFHGHHVVKAFDSLLKFSPQFFYSHLKMDAYAFVFLGNKIINGGVYDRVSSGEKNELEPYTSLLDSFADKSGFRNFYKNNLKYYNSLITDYKNNIDIAGMKSWLSKQFPSVSYSATKIIFSPLVGWNQSANIFHDNNFSESQAHVNFPFIEAENKNQPASIVKGKRMIIVFTELNHAYLNPVAEKFSKSIAEALKDLSKWTTAGKPSAGYDNSLVCFEEYLNYGLVSLYYSDLFDAKTFEMLTENIENSMTDSRGFQRFRQFNQELLELYKQRKPGETVADLYPAIIDWAAQQH